MRVDLDVRAVLWSVAWIGLNGVAGLLAMFPGVGILAFGGAALSVLFGVPFALLQYPLLRPHLPRARRWVGATILGWFLAWFLGLTLMLLWADLMTSVPPWWGPIVLSIPAGAVLGMPQAAVLGREPPQFGNWWVATSAFGTAIYCSAFVSLSQVGCSPRDVGCNWPLGAALGGIGYGTVTAPVLARLLQIGRSRGRAGISPPPS